MVQFSFFFPKFQLDFLRKKNHIKLKKEEGLALGNDCRRRIQALMVGQYDICDYGQ